MRNLIAKLGHMYIAKSEIIPKYTAMLGAVCTSAIISKTCNKEDKWKYVCGCGAIGWVTGRIYGLLLPLTLPVHLMYVVCSNLKE